MSLDGISNLDALLGNQVQSSEFNVMFNKDVNDGISLINYDPKNAGDGVYKDAIVAVLAAKRMKSLNAEWIQFDCNGVNRRFQLKWFDRGTEPDMNRFVGKLISCNILSNSYGKMADTEPVIIEVETVRDEEFNQALKYLQSESNNISALKQFIDKINYFDLLSKPKAKISLIKLGIQVKYAKIICTSFPTAKIQDIISALFMKALNVMVEDSDFDPDFIIYANIYKAAWSGPEIAKYFVNNSKHTDINSHIIKTVVDLTDNIMLGSTMI